jgi:DNA-binding transcriptional ArsR family regulator
VVSTVETIQRLLSERRSVSTRDLVEATGLTRQAVHVHISDLRARGLVASEGRGRATRYYVAQYMRTLPTAGLEEDRVWREMATALPELQDSAQNAVAILAYAVTEMLNNAVDHSGAEEVDVRGRITPETVIVDIHDRGRGAFAHVRDQLELETTVAAIQQLSKGKTTTDPQRHTGEGIFFTSKCVSLFELESTGFIWVVDNRRDDQALGTSEINAGTHVHLEVDRRTTQVLGNVFAEYSEGLAFNRSRAVVSLFEYGELFVSRSEAQRIADGLERFEVVVIDFRDVRLVGQGFVDQLFRVWAREHPEVELQPVNMNEAVEFMVRRGLAHRD